MRLTLLGIVILVKPVQTENAEPSMLVTLSGIVMLFRPVQPLNAKAPMLDPPVITTVFKEEGTFLPLSEDELAPNIYPKCVMVVPFPTKGNVILVSPVQPLNAAQPMLDPPVITTVFKEEGTFWLLLEYELAPNIYPKCVLVVPVEVCPTKGNVILVKLSQLENAEAPITFTLLGMTMLVRLLQLSNAEIPMLFTLS